MSTTITFNPNGLVALVTTLWQEILLALLVGIGIPYAFFKSRALLRESACSFSCNVPASLTSSSYAELSVVDKPSLHASGSTSIHCYAPASGKALPNINPVTPDGINRAVQKASAVQKEYKSLSWTIRRQILRSLLRHILDNQETFAFIACLDSGKTRVDASFGEILVTCEKLAWTIEHAEESLRPSRRPSNLLMAYKYNEVRYEPLGVVAALVSWNYPFHNILHPIISALATGNGVIIKPSEHTATSALFFIATAQRAMRACLPTHHHLDQLLQCAPCWPAAAEHLTAHPAISHITFIGSREVAQKVAASAAKPLTALTLELGGKDPAIILDNTPKSDIERIASILMRGTFQAAGQNCIGIERIIIQPRHLKTFLEILGPRVKAIRVGDALDPEHADEVDMGACISDARFDELERLIADAVKQGAILHAGGHRYNHPRYPQGFYFEPTMLSNVKSSMKIARTELFAPVMLILSGEETPTLDGVIALANSIPFALGASVFGKHGSKEIETVTQEIRAGMVSQNDFASYYLCSMPFGGSPNNTEGGGSGYGRFGGAEGLRSLCNAKSVNYDRWRGIIKTGIPSRLDYQKGAPDPAAAKKSRGVEQKKWRFASGITRLGFGLTLADKLGGLWDVIVNG